MTRIGRRLDTAAERFVTRLYNTILYSNIYKLLGVLQLGMALACVLDRDSGILRWLHTQLPLLDSTVLAFIFLACGLQLLHIRVDERNPWRGVLYMIPLLFIFVLILFYVLRAGVANPSYFLYMLLLISLISIFLLALRAPLMVQSEREKRVLEYQLVALAAELSAAKEGNNATTE